VLNLNERNSIQEKPSFSWFQRRLFIGGAFNNLHFERLFRLKWKAARQWKGGLEV
jgi:hypothetical protein